MSVRREKIYIIKYYHIQKRVKRKFKKYFKKKNKYKKIRINQ